MQKSFENHVVVNAARMICHVHVSVTAEKSKNSLFASHLVLLCVLVHSWMTVLFFFSWVVDLFCENMIYGAIDVLDGEKHVQSFFF